MARKGAVKKQTGKDRQPSYHDAEDTLESLFNNTDEAEESGDDSASTSESEGPQVVVDSSEDFRRLDTGPLPTSRRKLLSGKVKANKDLALVNNEVSESGSKKRRRRGGSGEDDDEDEAHMKDLDLKLRDMIEPLHSVTGTNSSKRDIRIPVYLPHDSQRAEGKAPKGATPLPKNAPRTLRRGVAKANLERTRRLDERSGVTPNQKIGRRTLTLKERRHLEGKDKRQRGLGGSIGKMTPKGLVLSQREIDSVRRGSK